LTLVRRPFSALAVPILLAVFALPAAARKTETGFLDRTVIVNSQIYRYQVFLPSNWDKQQKWPVVLFLHGYGERGDNGLLETDVGLPHAIRQRDKPMPFVVVMPQCLAGEHVFTDLDMEAVALAALKQSIKEFHGDPDRTYLTGLSMGGYATWNIAARHPGIFAAYVPVCAGIQPNHDHPQLKSSLLDDPSISNPYVEIARRIGKTPVWIFHGDADPSVPVEESRKMAQALRTAGGDVKYTEYPGVAHDSWVKAYAEPELVPWLLQQTLNH
jgi:predicted peptidase